MVTECVQTGSFPDRLKVHQRYNVLHVDVNRMQILIQDEKTSFEWYPAELFDIDLFDMCEDEVRLANLVGLGAQLKAMEEFFSFGFRLGIFVAKKQLTTLLERKGVKTERRPLEALIGLFHEAYPEPIPYDSGTSVQQGIENWYNRLTRIEMWLERAPVGGVTHVELEHCFRVTRAVHLRYARARNALEDWCESNGIPLKA